MYFMWLSNLNVCMQLIYKRNKNNNNKVKYGLKRVKTKKKKLKYAV